MPRTRARCPACQRGPYQLGNLYDHLRFVHWWKKDKIDDLKLTIKSTKYNGRQSVECECGKIYFSIHGLRVHREKAHGEEVQHSSNYFPVTCPACSEVFRTGEELAIHCNEMHRQQGGQDFAMIEGVFPSHEDFEAWIDSVEKLTKVGFTKRTSRLCKDGRNHIFSCRHARGKGAEVDPRELRQRFKKSDRVCSHCPAFIRAIENPDGSVSYRGCLGHLGHKVGVTKPQRTATQKFRRWQTHRRHKDALLYYTYRLNSITELSDNAWAIQSEDGYEYTVRVGDPCNCGETNNHCDRCGACPNQIQCNCSDVVGHRVSCIHAHAIATFVDKARERIPQVHHYLASEMPPCEPRPGPSPEQQDASCVDMYGMDDDHHVEQQYQEDTHSEDSQTLSTKSNSFSSLPQSGPLKGYPKVTVESLRPKVKMDPQQQSQSVVTLREEAREELEQFQGLDQKLHMMLQTCMQSNLPHVIRDIRSTIESKLSEILTPDKEKTSVKVQKPRLGKSVESETSPSGSQEPIEPMEDSSLDAHTYCAETSPDNKTPVTRKVLRREFLEAHSSKTRPNGEAQNEVLEIGPQQDKDALDPPYKPPRVPQRRVLRPEFNDSSGPKWRLLSEKELEQFPVKTKRIITSRSLPVVRREAAKPMFPVAIKKRVLLAPLPSNYRRVVKQVVTTQGGRRVVKRVVVRRPMLPQEKAQIAALEQSASEKQQNVEVIDETGPSGATSNPQEATATSDNADPLFAKCERPKNPTTPMSSKANTDNASQSSSQSSDDVQREESETSKDGGRIVKKIYARKGSEWVLKRVIIRPLSEDITNNAQASPSDKQGSSKASSTTGEDSANTTPRRIVKRVVVRRSSTIAPPDSQTLEITTPSPDATKLDHPHHTPNLIRRSLETALAPKPEKPAPRPLVCLMCGKGLPPEHQTGDVVEWRGCSNKEKCHVRAHEKCLRGAKDKCFVCHVGTLVKIQVKLLTKPAVGASVFDAAKGSGKIVGTKEAESLRKKSTEDRTSALCEVNS